MNSRVTITALLLIAFVCSHNLYLYCITNSIIDKLDAKSWYSGELLFFVTPLIFMGNSNIKTELEVQVRKVYWLFLCLVTFLIAFNNFRFAPFTINGIVLQMFMLNGITLVYAILSLILSDKNGNL